MSSLLVAVEITPDALGQLIVSVVATDGAPRVEQIRRAERPNGVAGMVTALTALTALTAE